MKTITESVGKVAWPRHNAPSIECRKKDLVIRIADWMKDKDEPAYDVECYIGGVYDWNESKCFTIYSHQSKRKCKQLAIEFAQRQIEKLL